MKTPLVLFTLLPLFVVPAVAQQTTIDGEVPTALQAVTVLRQQLLDPDSLVIEHVFASLYHKPQHPQLCITHRAHNSVGGYAYHVAEYTGGIHLNLEAENMFAGRCADMFGGSQNRWFTPAQLERARWAEITDQYRKAVDKPTNAPPQAVAPKSRVN